MSLAIRRANRKDLALLKSDARATAVVIAARVIAASALLFVSSAAAAQGLLDDKLAEPPFAKFYQGVRACLEGTRTECLTEFLDPTFVFHPWWQPGDARIPRAEFARFAHGVKPPGGRRTLWQMIAGTFSRGRVRELDGGVLFYSADIECRAYEVKDAYLVTHCDSRE